MSARRLSVAVVLAMSACAVFAFMVVPAGAETTRVFLGSFTGEGTPSGSFGNPNGIAVDESTGDVYVADIANGVVDKFDASGHAVDFAGLGSSALGGGGTPAKSFTFTGGKSAEAITPAGVAVDNDPLSPSFGDLYVVDAGHGAIDRFSSSGVYMGQLTGTAPGHLFDTTGEFGGPYGVAVDPNGNVWVYESNGEVDKFDSSGVFVSQFATGCVLPYPGLAVNSSEDVYVNCSFSIDEFGPGGVSLGTFPGGGNDAAVAVNEADDHLLNAREGGNRIQEFDSTGASVLAFFPEFPESYTGGLAVDGADGDLYWSDMASGAVYHWGPLVTVPDITTGVASGVSPSGATVNGVVNPDGIEVTACGFEYGTSKAYGQVASCAQEPGSGSGEVPVSAVLSGLLPNTTYHYRLIASNPNGNQGADQTFVTSGPATVDEESSENVGQRAATVTARINPHGFDTHYRFEYGTNASYGASIPVPDGDVGEGDGAVTVSAELSGLQVGATYHYRVVAASSQDTTDGFDRTFATVPSARISGVGVSALSAGSVTLNAEIDPLGSDTTYHFEYGASSSYGASIPVLEAEDKDIGSGEGNVAVSAGLNGLHSNTVYHYRVVAHNALGTAFSADHVFVYGTGGGGLPDGRAYEMVTPPQKNGARIGQFFLSLAPDYSEDGSRVVLDTLQCFGGAVSCNAARDDIVGSYFAFTRKADGWVTTQLAPPATRFEVSAPFGISADSGVALVSSPTQPFGEDDFYAIQPDGSMSDIGPVTQPLRGVLGPDRHGRFGLAMTADFSHVVFALAHEQAWPFDSTGAFGLSEYEYVGAGNSEPELVGVSGGRGSTSSLSTCSVILGGDEVPGFNALSADGETVYVTARPPEGQKCVGPPARELYARIGRSRSVLVSGRSPADCKSTACVVSAPGDALFGGASEDGSKVFFTSTQQLTDDGSEDSQPDDTATNEGCSKTVSANGCNLYLYDFDAAGGHDLIDVSAGDTSGLGPEVRGVVAISSGGSHVYFVARSVLTGQSNVTGTRAEGGANNLYMYERDAAHPEGHVAFIADLSASDEEDWKGTGYGANVTPDGRFLVLTSHAGLTPDARADGPAQVYRYDAQTGAMVRISIGDGGFNDDGNAGGGDASIVVPAHTSFTHASPARPDPTMSHDGSYVFFESPVGLTPAALNDVQINGSGTLAENVYEYHDGSVSLISDGRDVSQFGGETSESGLSSVKLLSSDASGSNVFFSTSDQLVPRDVDTQIDIYDARVCTADSPCITPLPSLLPPCLGEACHGTPAATPPMPSGPTATFNGQGNLIQSSPAIVSKKAKRKKPVKCAKGRERRGGKCVKQRLKRKTVKRVKSDKGGK